SAARYTAAGSPPPSVAATTYPGLPDRVPPDRVPRRMATVTAAWPNPGANPPGPSFPDRRGLRFGRSAARSGGGEGVVAGAEVAISRAGLAVEWRAGGLGARVPSDGGVVSAEAVEEGVVFLPELFGE